MPLEGEPVVGKTTNSAFVGTSLESMLDELGATTLVLCGVLTSNSLEATARHAGNLGYQAFVVADASRAVDKVDLRGRRWPAEDVHALSLAHSSGASCGATRCRNSSPSLRPASWRWRPAPRRITGRARWSGSATTIRLIPPAHVQPYVRRNKNDAADAAAICEAAGRPGQRFVPVRSIENQAELMRHRARELLAGQRTSLINALRGHHGRDRRRRATGRAARLWPEAPGRRRLRRERRDSWSPIACASRLRPLVVQIDALDEAIAAIDKELAASVKADETAKRLMTIPGVGPVTASAITATIQGHARLRQRARARRLPRPDAAPMSMRPRVRGDFMARIGRFVVPDLPHHVTQRGNRRE